jgi:hypothetical protein
MQPLITTEPQYQCTSQKPVHCHDTKPKKSRKHRKRMSNQNNDTARNSKGRASTSLTSIRQNILSTKHPLLARSLRSVPLRASRPVRFLCLLLSLLSSLCDVAIFHVVFEVSLLVEVGLRASLSAPKRTRVANDAPALFSALSCFSFDNNKTPK